MSIATSSGSGSRRWMDRGARGDEALCAAQDRDGLVTTVVEDCVLADVNSPSLWMREPPLRFKVAYHTDMKPEVVR